MHWYLYLVSYTLLHKFTHTHSFILKWTSWTIFLAFVILTCHWFKHTNLLFRYFFSSNLYMYVETQTCFRPDMRWFYVGTYYDFVFCFSFSSVYFIHTIVYDYRRSLTWIYANKMETIKKKRKWNSICDYFFIMRKFSYSLYSSKHSILHNHNMRENKLLIIILEYTLHDILPKYTNFWQIKPQKL